MPVGNMNARLPNALTGRAETQPVSPAPAFYTDNSGTASRRPSMVLENDAQLPARLLSYAAMPVGNSNALTGHAETPTLLSAPAFYMDNSGGEGWGNRSPPSSRRSSLVLEMESQLLGRSEEPMGSNVQLQASTQGGWSDIFVSDLSEPIPMADDGHANANSLQASLAGRDIGKDRGIRDSTSHFGKSRYIWRMFASIM